ncbi:endonuclease/exonuclease/phosphatase family protein [Saccharopolyspora sp. K220]|uniref:endonuclease/exonuclease/phosphatase family protein n=1 Tax=Saccharopolyspora soli TaxID=2926618 RepID=UPI001F58AD44|nr:endonuclease/exonuclease/phosphatase family protein [Saccharopolyspora soli]MCI2422886.1 endonuclease/exonuclease/phosphatase family protein [Saccharopolyspora soli]
MAGLTLRVGTFNIDHLGWQRGHGHHRLDAALDFLLEQTPIPPDILALPEATHCLDDGQYVLRRRLTDVLARHLDQGWYEPLFASQGLSGHANSHHLLLVNTAKVRPLGWYDPSIQLGRSRRLAGFAEVDIYGHDVLVCCEHWPGGEGREAFNRAANRLLTLGGPHNKTLLLGDFNATSSWEQEHLPDWQTHCEQRGELHKLEQKGYYNTATGRWEIDTRQLDKLRHQAGGTGGYLDMGEEADAPTVTTHDGSNLRIDRIFRSTGFPTTAVLTYHVRQPPRDISDHAYVYGTYTITPAHQPHH